MLPENEYFKSPISFLHFPTIVHLVVSLIPDGDIVENLDLNQARMN